ncbi:MAG TPA: UPF0175 family protein [Polyangiaceae bacterium]|nr:UPF0175 family protein [Polyangiaceae bacterium]
MDEPTELPEGTEVDLVALEGQPAAVEAELRLAAAMKMYELGRLSSGAAVQLVGLPKPAFLTKLADYAPGCRVLNGIFIKDMLVLRSA